jgi:hypothetical protein
MRMPEGAHNHIKASCRPFARRADLIITRLIMMRQTHAAQRIAAAVPTQLPLSTIVMLASRSLSGLPQNLDTPCISLAQRTGARSPAVSSKRLGEVQALERPPAEFAQRAGDISAAFSFVDAPSAALCISILGILPPSLASKHALDIANTHGSKLVYDLVSECSQTFKFHYFHH